MSSNPILSAERILARLQEAGIPQTVIAKKLVIPQSAVSNLYSGKRQLKLHEANILLSMLPAASVAIELPVIGLAGAGRWIEAIEETRQYLTVPSELAATAKFAVEVVGDSMNLLLAEGSFAVVDPSDTKLYVGKIYLLRNGDGEATVKRYRSDPARFEPVSDNPEYKPFEIGSIDFQVIGRVVSGVQKF